MEGKDRFAKCFVIIVGNCNSWTLKFVENRIQQKKVRLWKNSLTHLQIYSKIKW